MSALDPIVEALLVERYAGEWWTSRAAEALSPARFEPVDEVTARRNRKVLADFESESRVAAGKAGTA